MECLVSSKNGWQPRETKFSRLKKCGKFYKNCQKWQEKMLMISKHGNCMTTVGKMFLLAQKKSKKNSKNGKKIMECLISKEWNDNCGKNVFLGLKNMENSQKIGKKYLKNLWCSVIQESWWQPWKKKHFPAQQFRKIPKKLEKN
jgi:hypothetical protein